MTSDFYVYGLFDKSRLFYIGKGYGKRAYNHIGEARRGSKCPVHKKIRAMSHEHDVKILAPNLTEKQAYELEELVIITSTDRYDKSGPLLNLTLGGRGGHRGHSVVLTPEQILRKNKALTSPEVRAKMSAAHKGIKVYTPEGFAAIRRIHKGKILSPETRAKISEAKVGKPGHPHTQEFIDNLIKRNTGRIVSQAIRAKIATSVRKTGMTDEQKIKQRKSVLCKVSCPQCGKIGARSIMMRWHFDNCRIEGTK